jgi:hypothetical protein
MFLSDFRLAVNPGYNPEIILIQYAIIFRTARKISSDMKYLLFLVHFSLIALTVNSQNSIPNGNFENWAVKIYNYPRNYPRTSNIDAFLKHINYFNVVRTTDRFHGNYAIRLSTLASSSDTSSAYVFNVTKDGDIFTNLGIPYTQIPTGIRGYYKYNSITEDSGLVITAFWKGGNIINSYFFKLGGKHTSYSLFNFKYNPLFLQIPDSIILGFTSSDIISSKPKPGSTLSLDSLSFTGVTSQPLQLNGDFESWSNDTLYSLDVWNSNLQGIHRTRDSYNGSYAVELKTYLGYENNVITSIAGRISNGNYSNTCNCMTGGIPFNSKKDALIFHYKYSPMVTIDNAEVSLTFKKNGLQIGGENVKLQPSASYKYVEIPFDLPSVPDTLILDIRSSLQENKAVSFAGASFKIDQLNFKSQNLVSHIKETGKKIDIQVYPNPTDGQFTLQLPENSVNLMTMEITIINLKGQIILRDRIKNLKTDFDLSVYPGGLYFIILKNTQSIQTFKITKY